MSPDDGFEPDNGSDDDDDLFDDDLFDDDLYDDDEVDLHGVRLVVPVRDGKPAKFRIRSNFDVTWFAIALEHERAALAARDRAVSATDEQAMKWALDDELHAGMVTIAAAAFAIDALYSKLADMLEGSERPVLGPDAKRSGRIVETFKRALQLGKIGQAWQKSIPTLFAQRDALVHFKGDLHNAAVHPSGKAYVSLESITYRAEAATSAVDLALEVLTTAYRSPRPTLRAIVTWSSYNAHVPAGLEQSRAANRRNA